MLNLFLVWMQHLWTQPVFLHDHGLQVLPQKLSTYMPWTHYWGRLGTVVHTLNLATRWRWLIRLMPQLVGSITGLNTMKWRQKSPSLSEWNDSSCAAQSWGSILITLSQFLQVPPHDQHTCNCRFLLSISAQFLLINIHISYKGLKTLKLLCSKECLFVNDISKTGRKKIHRILLKLGTT
jgi:hypothetical protein